jgi:hypothetical protein
VRDTSPPPLMSLACVLMCSAMEELFSFQLEWQLWCAGVKTEFVLVALAHDTIIGMAITSLIAYLWLAYVMLRSMCKDTASLPRSSSPTKSGDYTHI